MEPATCRPFPLPVIDKYFSLSYDPVVSGFTHVSSYLALLPSYFLAASLRLLVSTFCITRILSAFKQALSGVASYLFLSQDVVVDIFLDGLSHLTPKKLLDVHSLYVVFLLSCF